MAVIRFPKPYQEPPPEESEQFELFDELPVLGPEGPLSERRVKKLVAAIAADLDEISEFVDSVREGVALLQQYFDEGKS